MKITDEPRTCTSDLEARIKVMETFKMTASANALRKRLRRLQRACKAVDGVCAKCNQGNTP